LRQLCHFDFLQLSEELTTRVRDLESQLVTEREKMAQFEVSFSALQDAKQTLAARFTSLKKEKDRLEDECLRLTKDNKSLSCSVAELTSKLERQVGDQYKVIPLNRILVFFFRIRTFSE
jgi:predicted  nucleic acid-binding Zn-ribbon protein